MNNIHCYSFFRSFIQTSNVWMNDNITIPRPIASAFKEIAAFFILPARKEEKGRDAEYKSRKEKNEEMNSFKGKGNRKSRTAGKARFPGLDG
ncbi:hypothetical protein [uncultured Akkermansia sp.]|uniref:hypothetical protein n=1 Tax=uncultured Akkermansia sp. TaxID=512294 RepID=UPI00265CEE79|nr:hypothetical protein [uncultured Akkermansia sp.]